MKFADFYDSYTGNSSKVQLNFNFCSFLKSSYFIRLNFEFQRLRGELTISKDPHRNTETFSPYTGGFPLGMGVAFTRETTANIANLEPKE